MAIEVSKVGSEFLVNTQTANGQYGNAVTGLADGRFAVGWVDDSGTLGDASRSSLKAQIFSVGVVNAAPALTGAQATLANGTEDTAYTVTATDLLASFADANGDALSRGAVTVGNGTVTDNADGTYTITPNANVNGTQQLS